MQGGGGGVWGGGWGGAKLAVNNAWKCGSHRSAERRGANRPLAFTLGFEQTVAGPSDAAGKPTRVGELSAGGIIFKLILQERSACDGVDDPPPPPPPPLRWWITPPAGFGFESHSSWEMLNCSEVSWRIARRLFPPLVAAGTGSTITPPRPPPTSPN